MGRCECRYKNCNEKSTFSFNGWNNFSKADLKRLSFGILLTVYKNECFE